MAMTNRIFEPSMASREATTGGKVLLVIDSLEPGGTEHSLLEICRRFERWVPVVCHLSPAASLAPAYEAAGVRCVSLDLTGKYPFLTGARYLRQLIAHERPLLVHSHLYNAGLGSRLGTPRRLPLVHTWTSEPVARRPSAPGRGWRRRVAARLDAWTARRVDLFLANSRTIVESNARALGVEPERVRVIYRGRDPARFIDVPADGVQRAEAKLGLAPEDRVLLHVGRLRPVKRQGDLLRALPRILEAHPTARLVIAGEGPARGELQRLAAGLALGDRVLLPGHREDIPALLARAELFLFPSALEGHPGAVVEAMMAARPVVASDIPAHRETLEHGVTGLLVPPADPETLAEAVIELLRDRQAARHLGREARRVARERFDIHAVARRHEEIYDQLCNNRGRHDG